MTFFKTLIPSGRLFVLALALTLCVSIVQQSAIAGSAEAAPAKADTAALAQTWGVEPVALRLTAADHFIDFRYRVIDSEKAKALLKRPIKAYLIDEKSGEKMPVPITKLGPLRSSAVDPKPNKNYVVLFENLNKKIVKGNLVTVVIGDFRAEHLSVE